MLELTTIQYVTPEPLKIFDDFTEALRARIGGDVNNYRPEPTKETGTFKRDDQGRLSYTPPESELKMMNL